MNKFKLTQLVCKIQDLINLQLIKKNLVFVLPLFYTN